MITLEGESVTLTDPHRHKYGSALAEYIDLSAGARGGFDNFTGDSDAPMGYVSLHGKRILLGDSRGFVDVDTYPSVESARAVFDAIDAWYGAWSEDDDDGSTYGEWLTPDRQAELTERETYTRYVIACATENLDAYSMIDWRIRNRPRGPLG